jgi:hypothetical protein
MASKFKNVFQALMSMGSDYLLSERLSPLTAMGQPLWEFTLDDHRLFCTRTVKAGKFVDVVLLNGWVDDKSKTERENREIEQAKRIYAELQDEYPGGEK